MPDKKSLYPLQSRPEKTPIFHKIKDFHGHERTIYCIDEEVPFPDGKLIVSSTNFEGVITYANEIFVEMSGYSKEELMWTPHSILRHPDMPAVAFKGLWDDIKEGNKWQGYVKNLRKDGRYYWVHATVLPHKRQSKIVGYTSVRRRPDPIKIQEMIPLYQKLLKEEQ